MNEGTLAESDRTKIVQEIIDYGKSQAYEFSKKYFSGKYEEAFKEYCCNDSSIKKGMNTKQIVDLLSGYNSFCENYSVEELIERGISPANASLIKSSRSSKHILINLEKSSGSDSASSSFLSVFVSFLFSSSRGKNTISNQKKKKIVQTSGEETTPLFHSKLD